MRNMLAILQHKALSTIRITSAAPVHVAQRKTDKTQHCLSYPLHLNIYRHGHQIKEYVCPILTSNEHSNTTHVKFLSNDYI